MSKTVHKYPFVRSGEQKIEMPEGARIIRVDLDANNIPHVWAVVDTLRPLAVVVLHMRCTGDDVPEKAEWVASFQNGTSIYHVFAEAPALPPEEGSAVTFIIPAVDGEAGETETIYGYYAEEQFKQNRGGCWDPDTVIAWRYTESGSKSAI